MTIKEIETLSGLPRANIRYYESEGLIAPKRAENGYREYSQADAEVLLRVKLLRALPWYLVLQATGVDPKARLTSIWLSILGMVTMLVLEPLLLPTKRLPPPRDSCWTSRCRSFTHRPQAIRSTIPSPRPASPALPKTAHWSFREIRPEAIRCPSICGSWMGNASTLQPNEQADTDLLRLFTKNSASNGRNRNPANCSRVSLVLCIKQAQPAPGHAQKPGRPQRDGPVLIAFVQSTISTLTFWPVRWATDLMIVRISLAMRP